MEIYVVRHGQTDWNLAERMQGGGSEKKLNETGIKQAKETKQELENVKYDVLICSPMHRAIQTAEIINKERNVPIIIDDRISVMSVIPLTGLDPRIAMALAATVVNKNAIMATIKIPTMVNSKLPPITSK